MKTLSCLPPALMAAALIGAASPPDHVARRCTGTETVQVGTQKPRTVPYALTFSADLGARRVCYGSCAAEQTFVLPAPSGKGALMLAAIETPAQGRRLIYDSRSNVLTDDLRIDFGLGTIVHHARATCKPAAFREPPRPNLTPA